MSSYGLRALKRVKINHVPAIGLALAATALTIATPLTAAADSSHAGAATTVRSAVVQHTAAAKKASASASSAKKTAAAKNTASATKSTSTAAKTTSTATKSTSTQSTAAKTTTVASSSSTTASSQPYAGVSYSELEPTGTEGSQQTFSPDSDQWTNATAIVQAAKDLNMSAYAATIAVATAMQESSLHNLTTATNADSLGLFQQRPSMGWGTASELTDPTYAAKAFLRELPSGYENMNLADAAQSVQRSFDGSLYSQWESQAAYMVHHIANS